jgi:hypothetical protein
VLSQVSQPSIIPHMAEVQGRHFPYEVRLHDAAVVVGAGGSTLLGMGSPILCGGCCVCPFLFFIRLMYLESHTVGIVSFCTVTDAGDCWQQSTSTAPMQWIGCWGCTG